jgi:tetraacyldisaccharide 4'-kinase
MNTRWQLHLRTAWRRRGWLACLLWPISVIVAMLSYCHRWWYRSGAGTVEHAPIPVLVVGNVVAGGVGKTPVVMSLVEHLGQRGVNAGIVSRGYGRQGTSTALVQADSTAAEVGDEPLLMFRRCHVPVAVAARRMDAIRCLLMQDPQLEVIVSDDGLQHHALHHDLALCVFDDRGVGNGWHLPAGPLREAWPRPSAPGVLQCVLNTGRNPRIPGYQAQRALASEAINGLGQRRPLSYWHDRPVAALAGIAQPELFFDMLRDHGLTLERCYALPDHDPLTEAGHAGWPVAEGVDLLCTEKDAVKLWPSRPQVWAVPLLTTLPLELLSRIDDWLDAKLSSDHGHQTA